MPGYCSDHSLVCIAFKTDTVKRSPTFWKFNNLLLRDPVFVSLVKQLILDVEKQYALPIYNTENIYLTEDEQLVFTMDDQLLFEILLEIRDKCILYASFKKKENARLEIKLV